MIKRSWDFLKETGLFGNLVAAAIIWLFGLSLTFLNRISAFNYNINFSIPLLVLLSIIVVACGAIYLLFCAITNPIRQFSNVFGYYRTMYHSTTSPYIRSGSGYCTRIVKQMDYRITKNGITCIGPLSFYAHKPRSINGKEVITINEIKASLNDLPNINVEMASLGTDGYSVTLRSIKPLKKGDLIEFSFDYTQQGVNAICQEELDEYKNLPDLKNNMRNKIVKERNVEYIYASPTYSIKYVVEVVFPQNYPWKLLDSTEDMVIISLSSKPIDKSMLKKIANISIEPNKIHLDYKHNFRSAHGHYIIWRLPSRKELDFFYQIDAQQGVVNSVSQ